MSCPSPFVALDDYPAKGGNLNARMCSAIPTVDGAPTCCLPCPIQQWFYPDHFVRLIQASTYLNLAGVLCCCFLLLSFAVLPVEYTLRHYLSVCLTFATLVMQLSFVVPLSANASPCYDKITPHDMYSSINCAISGALVVGGAWCTAMWILLRTLSLHLQICWQMVPGRKFFLASQAAGWTIPVIFLAVGLSITGVSFRFGDSCHINSTHSLQTFWGPLLAVAAASIVTQTITFVYCIQVYLRSLFEEKQATLDSHLPYANSTAGTVTAAQALRRIQRVVALQWKGIAVVIIIISDVIFLATVFLRFDQNTRTSTANTRHELAWLLCMLENDGNKNKCLDTARYFVVPEATALSVLFLLACNGIWAVLLLGRVRIFVGWVHFFKNLFGLNKPTDEFVSISARLPADPTVDPSTTYEMLDSKKGNHHMFSSSSSEREVSGVIISAPEPTIAAPSSQPPPSLAGGFQYDPSTFSIAKFRNHAEPGSSLDRDRFSPYRDRDSGSRSPGSRSPVSPYSPYRENSNNNNVSDYLSSQQPAYIAARVRDRSGSSSNASSSTPTPSPYPEDGKIGWAQ